MYKIRENKIMKKLLTKKPETKKRIALIKPILTEAQAEGMIRYLKTSR